MNIEWIQDPCPILNSRFKEAAIQRQSQLTKPSGALGYLENIAIRMADLQQSETPSADHIAIAVFAADHGVAVEGVSAFPQEVTAQMVVNFLQGGAAISVMAKQLNASLEVIDVGIVTELPKQQGLIIQRAGRGTANSMKQPAMDSEQLAVALTAGFDAIKRAVTSGANLFIGGEMGIANTTSASVLYSALLGITAEESTGAGTGLDSEGIRHKTNIVKQILDKHRPHCKEDTLEWLRCAGGFEIAALTGAYIRAAQCRLPVLVDGFISSVAALCAVRIQPDVNDYLFFSHVSAEHGHRRVLEHLNHKPLLDLGMRLGEGSGAAVAATVMQSACVLHSKMATFEEAAVATRD